MQKLVSKNPVLRFKEGKKIVKALRGNLFIYYTGRDGINYEAWRGGDDWYYRQKGGTGMTRMPYDYTTTTGQRFYSSTPRGVIANTYDVVNNMSKTSKATPTKTKTVVFPEEVDPNYTHNFLEALRAGYRPNADGTWKSPETTKQKSSTTVKSKPRSGWSYGYNRSNEISDIKATQQMLKDAGYLSSDKYNVVDGKWGSDTENAYKKYLLNKEKPVVAPTIQQISLTPLDNTIHEGFTQVMNTPPIIANLPKQRNFNFNKSLIRNLISLGGFDPYKYTGALRKALRLYLNGESDDTSLLDGTNLARFTLPFRKQGGQLISRNPVERFKNKIK